MDTLMMLKSGPKLRGTVELPLSKSLFARVLLLKGETSAEPPCEDSRVLLDALRNHPTHIDVGAAGTAMRFLTAYLSTQEGSYTLTGSPRMRQRPIGILVNALRQLGASIEYVKEEGFPPLRIEGGKLHGGCVEMRGDVSSQYVSALLLAAPHMEKDLSITLTGDILSRPYIDTTLGLMQRMGHEAFWQDERTVFARCGTAHSIELPDSMLLERDWSAASYWYEMVALSPDALSRIELPGLQEDSLQGDSAVATLFRPLGVHTEYTPQGIILTKGEALAPHVSTSLRSYPDLAQTLVATCLSLHIPFSFTGLSNLRIKETDRLEAMRCEFRRLGFVLTVTEDGTVSWDGTCVEAEEDPLLHTYEDHRMALSLAPLCYQLSSLRLQNPDVVVKSYPLFWKHFSQFNTIDQLPTPPKTCSI